MIKRFPLFAFVLCSSLMNASSATWETLAPVPDPVGFAGMFAGVSDGRLIAGGGSQFADQPLWEGGTKSYSDRIVVLDDLRGQWKLLDTRLPEPRAHAALASAFNRVYLVGGMNDNGLLSSALSVSLSGDDVQITPLPALPHPLGYGAAVVVGQSLIVTGGAQTPSLIEPSAATWRLRLTADGSPEGTWEKLPDLPEDGAFAPAAATDGKNVYVFGGGHFGIDPESKILPIPLKTVYCLHPEGAAWEKISDLPLGRLAPVSPCGVTPDGGFIVAGGYGIVFEGAQKDHPGFENGVFVFQPKDNSWRQIAPFPKEPVYQKGTTTSAGPEPVVAAPGATWKDHFLVVGGEVRPGVRTPAVIAIDLKALGRSGE